MSLTVVGSIAFDAVKTPFGARERMLGGAATHFSLAASFFDEVRPVGPVGDDFGPEDWEVLQTRGTITDDVEHVPGGKTFFWAGEYSENLNERVTHVTDLNVFADFEPKLSPAAQVCDVLFLAHIQPDLQLGAREEIVVDRLVARWPTGPRWPRTTSRSSAPSAWRGSRPTRSPRAWPTCSA